MARLHIIATSKTLHSNSQESSATSTGSSRPAIRTSCLFPPEPFIATSGIADQAFNSRRYQLGTVPADDFQLQQTVVCVRMKNRREFSTICVLHLQLDGIRVLALVRRTLISGNDESHPSSTKTHFHGRCESKVGVKLRGRGLRQMRCHSLDQLPFKAGNSTRRIAHRIVDLRVAPVPTHRAPRPCLHRVALVLECRMQNPRFSDTWQ